MIPAGDGAVFTTAADGDMRHDPSARARLGLPPDWATVRQVHGSDVVRVTGPGDHGSADGLVTSTRGVPLAVFTADCMGIVLHAEGEVGVLHAGWRGLAAGVIERVLERMGAVASVAIGPHIRACCFEVGPEVADLFEGHLARTTAGTVSVDLAAAAAARLPVPPTVVERCTRCGVDAFSHRRDATSARMAAIGWLP
ncbi:MAG TPA: polyphenol oxidase family protein [Acidimicrobiia bacterium]|nr:polyphenol oxidase family protein [Acidimicrobiia bacterium]